MAFLSLACFEMSRKTALPSPREISISYPIMFGDITRKVPMTKPSHILVREHSSLRLLILLATVALGGCGPTVVTVPIEGKDGSVFFPSLRVSYPIRDHDGLHGSSDHALEVDVSEGKGAGRQTVRSREKIDFGGTMLPGPADVRQDFTLDAAQAALRMRFPRNARVFLEFLIGGLYSKLDLRLQSGDLAVQRDFRDAGLVGGVGIGSRITDRLILDLRMVFDLGIYQSRQMSSTEALVSYWMSRNVAVTGGYRYWGYGRTVGGGSNIDSLVWKGFSGGIAYSF